YTVWKANTPGETYTLTATLSKYNKSNGGSNFTGVVSATKPAGGVNVDPAKGVGAIRTLLNRNVFEINGEL
ncbi:MAG: hypothetical protein LBL49_00915, partial [Clostridiales Family XIII bacterium]|nr:hypothetical protein [Clostridiales Family XIII bacterium]MDR1134733.1 hypothetical protein [Clostridiales Family XIII bacterium]